MYNDIIDYIFYDFKILTKGESIFTLCTATILASDYFEKTKKITFFLQFFLTIRHIEAILSISYDFIIFMYPTYYF